MKQINNRRKIKLRVTKKYTTFKDNIVKRFSIRIAIELTV